MQPNKLKVIIDLDITKNVFSISYLNEGVDSCPMDVIEIPLSDLAGSPDTAGRKIGDAVLSIFDHFVDNGLGLKDYHTNSRDILERSDKQIEGKAKKGDPSAQYALALKYLSDTATTSDFHLLELAEEWFHKSAAGGYEKAIQFLKEWPEMKEARRQSIERRKNRGSS